MMNGRYVMPFGGDFTIAMVKHRLELSDYFKMYRCQQKFASFSPTIALAASWQYFNYPSFAVCSVY